MSDRRDLHKIAADLVDFIDKNPTDRGKGRGPGHDVSSEPRVPKGNSDGGQWTTGGASGGSGSTNSGGGRTNSSGRSSTSQARASARGTTVTIIHPDGTAEIRKGGSHAWRNNNPGNIEAGRGAREKGAVGSDGRFAIFPDEATGTSAQEDLLKGPYYSGMTIDEAVAAWAPEKDGNDTAAYQAFVRKASGLDGDRKIGDLTPEERQRFMAAQRRMEGWKPGAVGFLGRQD